MNKAHYIIFHPENKRQLVKVSATVIRDNQVMKNWNGNIFVDKMGEGDEISKI